MKYLTITTVIIASLLTAVAYESAWTAPKGEKGVVVGNVMDIATYAMKGVDEDSVETFKSRTSQGFPVGIIEEGTNKVYICVYKNPAPASGLQLANEILKPYMGMKVAAQGLKYHAEGVNVLRLSVISEY